MKGDPTFHRENFLQNPIPGFPPGVTLNERLYAGIDFPWPRQGLRNGSVEPE